MLQRQMIELVMAMIIVSHMFHKQNSYRLVKLDIHMPYKIKTMAMILSRKDVTH